MNRTTTRGLRAATPSPLLYTKSTQLGFQASRTPLQFRYASSATSTALKHTPPSPQNSSEVNGPLTTLPAPLELPERAPDQNIFSFLFKTGKTYITFYKTGVKNTYTNYQLAKKIQARLKSSNLTLKEAVQKSKITRSDFQLLRRNNHDVKRVPIFGLVLLICGEFTPLVVLAFSSVVPWTCRIPKQIDKDRRKLEKRRNDSFSELEFTPKTPPPSTVGNIKTNIKGLESWELQHINSSLGLSSILWEWFFGPPERLLRRRVGQHMEYLDLDDQLIIRAGGWHDVSGEEIKMACVERGLDVTDMHEAELRRNLDAWLKNEESVGMETILKTRPHDWQHLPLERPVKDKGYHHRKNKHHKH